MAENKTFTPRVIARDEKAIRETLQNWETLTAMANLLLMDAALFLKDDSFDANDFLKLNFMAKPEDLIAQLVTIKGDAPGINAKRLVELNLIEGDLQELYENFRAFQSAYSTATKIFKWPLQNAVNPEGLFFVPEELILKIENYFTDSTTHPAENEALDVLQRFIDSVNDLARIGLAHPKLGRIGLNSVINLVGSTPDRKEFHLLWNSFRILRNRISKA